MKHLAVALIVLGVVAADFFAEVLELSAKSQKAWSQADTLVLVLAFVWFAIHVNDDESKP